MSSFYLRHELCLRCGFYLGAAPLATCFAGALAYAITYGHQHSIAPWQLLFLIEGLPVNFAGAVAWFFLPDSPEKATFLTEEELAAVKARKVWQTGLDEGHCVRGVSLPDNRAALCDLKVPLFPFPIFPPTKV